ncbi:AAA family ATPase [Promicromonospora sp. NFX87]|uniref:AAA family ATPase n=1 Tax=Promicromonospora sp. NFX87 TaxID=3402691 RepID=UPI003AFB501C
MPDTVKEINLVDMLTDEEKAEVAEEHARHEFYEAHPPRLKGVDWLPLRKPVPALITGYMPRYGLGQIYAPSYSGKTYVTLSLVLAVCAGHKEWFGLPLNLDGPQTVVYIASEGGQVFWDAVEAWLEAHPDSDLSGLHVLDSAEGDRLGIEAPNAKEHAIPFEDSMQRLRTEMAFEGIDPTIVVIDPQLNTMYTVDENSNIEMVQVYSFLKSWAETLECLVLLVHHTGHDKSRGRGASSQGSALDLMIALKMTGKGCGEISFEKVKGEIQPEPLGYNIARLPIPHGSGSGAYAYRDDSQTKSGREDEKESVDRVLRERVLQAVKDGKDSASGIAKHLGADWNRNKVQRFLDELAAAGMVENTNVTDNPRQNQWIDTVKANM